MRDFLRVTASPGSTDTWTVVVAPRERGPDAPSSDAAGVRQSAAEALASADKVAAAVEAAGQRFVDMTVLGAPNRASTQKRNLAMQAEDQPPLATGFGAPVTADTVTAPARDAVLPRHQRPGRHRRRDRAQPGRDPSTRQPR
ncbi:MAG: hypothetical protein LC749_07390 [Actinobacteria bacterium]|nr:hypothetical protein [Actinomycetota bacterium]